MRFDPALAVEDHRHVPPVEGGLGGPEIDREPEEKPRRVAKDSGLDAAVERLARALIDGAARREDQRIGDRITIEGNVAAGPKLAL